MQQALPSPPSSLDFDVNPMEADQDSDEVSDPSSLVDLELGLGPKVVKKNGHHRPHQRKEKSKSQKKDSRPVEREKDLGGGRFGSTGQQNNQHVQRSMPAEDLLPFALPQVLMAAMDPLSALSAEEYGGHPYRPTKIQVSQPPPSPTIISPRKQPHAPRPSPLVKDPPPLAPPTSASKPRPPINQDVPRGPPPAKPEPISTVKQVPLAKSSSGSRTKELPPGITPLSVCSFNTFLLPSLFAPTGANSMASSTPSDKNLAGLTHRHSTSSRSERIADFCRGLHICLLQEVWGPGVDALTVALSSTHSIPPSLKSTTKLSLLADAVNTIALYLSATGGLWLAYSRADGWNAGEEYDYNQKQGGSSFKPRYPPTKRPEPHLSLFPVPLTVPSSRTFTASVTRSRKGIRCILLDASQFWGKGKRILCFNTHLDAQDTPKRGRQLKEIASYIREVVLSLSSIVFDTASPSVSARRKSSSEEGNADDFDMLEEEFAFLRSSQRPVSPPTSPLDRHAPTSLLDSTSSSITSEAAAIRYALPPMEAPHNVHHLKTVAKDTAIILAGDFNIVAGTAEYRDALIPLLGPTSPKLIDYFDDGRGKRRGLHGNGVPTYDPTKNTLIKALEGVSGAAMHANGSEPTTSTSFFGWKTAESAPVPTVHDTYRNSPSRVDYIFGLDGVDVGGGVMVPFLKLDKVAGEIMDRDDMSDHWPVIGNFVPAEL
ncbi:hypothetical protein HDU97_007468 [Phlyctochytrium planicorne]|nr:hypothetical protein HDU97_007468 [Phlyctochytrium planicorne]